MVKRSFYEFCEVIPDSPLDRVILSGVKHFCGFCGSTSSRSGFWGFKQLH